MVSRLHRRETFGQNQVSIAFRILIVEAVEPDVKSGLERKVRIDVRPKSDKGRGRLQREMTNSPSTLLRSFRPVPKLIKKALGDL